jgi:hypothetical protein
MAEDLVDFSQPAVHPRFSRSGLCSGSEIGADCRRMEGAMRPVEAVMCGLVVSCILAAILNVMISLL